MRWWRRWCPFQCLPISPDDHRRVDGSFPSLRRSMKSAISGPRDVTTRTSPLPSVNSLSARPLFRSELLPTELSAVEASCLDGGSIYYPTLSRVSSFLYVICTESMRLYCFKAWLRFWVFFLVFLS